MKNRYIHPAVATRTDRHAAMSENSAHFNPSPPDDIQALREEIAELTRRSLLEIGKMSEIADQMKTVSHRIAELTARVGPPLEVERD